MKQEPVRKTVAVKKRADHYDDPTHNNLRAWSGRDYEHAAEELAIRRLLGPKRFSRAVDVGGGYGRLCVLLSEYAEHVILAEPSSQQLEIAKGFLVDYPQVERKLVQAADLQVADESVDLLIMIRVMQHLPDPSAEFSEIARVLTADGYGIIEVANYLHGRNRLKHVLRGKKMPAEPVDIRSEAKRNDENEIAFVNHNPETIIKQLAHAGLKVENALSVSNLRSSALKKVMPKALMVSIEKVLQNRLAPTYFGPSVFFLIKKA